jgi:uncharacterized protein YraI
MMTVKLRLLATVLITFLFSGLVLTAGLSAVRALPHLPEAAVDVTVTANANLRAGPGTSFARVGAATAGDTLRVSGCNSDCTWYRTAAGGWIAGELLADPPTTLPRVSADGVQQPGGTATPGTGSSSLVTATPPAHTTATAEIGTVTDNANLRAGPGTDFARAGSVQAGAVLTLTGETAKGDWLQLANGTWIAAFLVEKRGSALPVVTDLPAQLATPAHTATPESAAQTEPTAAITPAPDAAETAESVAATAPPAGTRDLVVEFINPHYNCEQGEYEFEGTPGIAERIWAYRSFQVDMYITNNGTDPIAPTWHPTRWIITDGANEMINDQMWQWISRYSGKYEQPTIFPGQMVGWTWIAMPVGPGEWVKAVEYEHNGQLYRQEFDLGPYGNAYNYINCGQPGPHNNYPTPTPKPWGAE